MSRFRLTLDAIEDLDGIWQFIFRDNPKAADAVEGEIRAACAMLAKAPLSGHLRSDLTPLPVRFWTIPKYRNYVIVYRPDSKPLEIIRILHGMRNLKQLLK